MLWHAAAIKGYAVAASDGEIGTVSDFLFDDTSWLVRWLVVDTGNWLSGRKVLLPSSALGSLDAKEEKCSVKLTMQQIKDSPEIDTDRPVSRQMETNAYGYYGYSPYWNSGYGYMGGIGYMGGYGYMGGMGGAVPISLGLRRREAEIADAQASRAARGSARSGRLWFRHREYNASSATICSRVATFRGWVILLLRRSQIPNAPPPRL